jgi:peptidoglycan/LPS O-acetylase OafA/YrhL
MSIKQRVIWTTVSMLLMFMSMFGAHLLYLVRARRIMRPRTHVQDMSTPTYIFIYAGAARTIWSMGVALMIALCHTGNAVWLDDVLGWPPLRVPARLTYCVFLIHELMLIYLYHASRTPIHYDGNTTFVIRYVHCTPVYDHSCVQVTGRDIAVLCTRITHVRAHRITHTRD